MKNTVFESTGINRMHMMDELQPIRSLMDDVAEQMREKEESLFIKILIDYLGRKPTEDDARRCTLASHESHPGKRLFAYDDVVLGRIEQYSSGLEVLERRTQMSMGWRFVPGVNTFE